MRRKLFKHAAVPVLLLILLTSILLFLPVGSQNLFGSEGDWCSQHVAVAQSLRLTMKEQKSILPQWVNLGAGSSAYDFAYYGLLRPDVLLACLFDGIPMEYIIAGYAAAGVYAAALLCYFWLLCGGRSRPLAFAGAVLFVSAACFYQAHHQIIFVNYMPFLMLALLGVDRLAERRRGALLALSVCLIILHSFYYAPACLCVIAVYGMHRICAPGEKAHAGMEGTGTKSSSWGLLGRMAVFTALGVGMSMILILPTGLAILSTSKDAGNFGKEALRLADPGLEALLYSPYGCGMTLLTLYCLLLSLGKKNRRFLACCLLTAVSVPAVSLVLNGFLYARGKILIPFVPLLVLVTIDTLQALWEKRQAQTGAAVLVLPLLCLLPAIFSAWRPLVIVDGGILFVWLWWWRRRTVKTYGFWLILLVPFCVSLGVSLRDSSLGAIYQKLGIPGVGNYLAKAQAEEAYDLQQWLSGETLIEAARDGDYHFEILTDAFMNANILGSGAMQRTSIYSSVSNAGYARFFYDTAGNAISYNNRVALVPGQNPWFNYFMGVRYLLVKRACVPYGYEILEERGDLVLAENRKVLPVCYGMSAEEYKRCSKKTEFLQYLSEMEDTAEVQSVAVTDLDRLSTAETKARKVLLHLDTPLSSQVLVVRFHVDRSDGREVVISLNGIKNKLSSAQAPYPNGNEVFTYVLDSGEMLEQLELQLSAGSYRIQNFRVCAIDRDALLDWEITKTRRTDAGEKSANVYEGRISMKESGYFLTSYPYRRGYRILVDGRERSYEKVNTAFVGFPLEAGEHRIEIRYQAPGYVPGKLISLCSGVLLVILTGAPLCTEGFRKFKMQRKNVSGGKEGTV